MVDLDGDGTPDNLPIGTATPITDAAGDPIGTMTLNSDGSFTFEPAPAYDGPVPTTTYTISDGTDTATAELSFDDVPNTPPVAVDDGPVVTAPNTVATGNVIGNDSDSDGDILTVDSAMMDLDGDGFLDVLPIGTVTAITNLAGDTIGTLVLNINGDFTFTPDSAYKGPVPTATYTLSDGTVTDTAQLSFMDVPNAPPVAIDDGVIVTQPFTTAAGNVLDNDTDSNDDPLTVTEFTVDGITALAGTPILVPGIGTFNVDANGDFSFLPDPAHDGPVPTVSYTVTDGTDTDTGELSFADVPVSGVDVNELIGEQKDSPDDTNNSGKRYVSANGEYPSGEYPREEAIGIIIEAVSDLNSLGSLADIDTFSPILSAVNGIESLDGIFLNTVNGVENLDGFNKQHFDEVARNIMDFDADIQDGDAQIQTNKSFNVDSFLKDGRVFLQANNLEGKGAGVKDFTAMLADGRALPNWISSDNNGLFIIDAPAEVESISLTIIGLRDDGISSTRVMEVDLLNSAAKDLRELQRNVSNFSQAVDNTLQAHQAGRGELQQILLSNGPDHG